MNKDLLKKNQLFVYWTTFHNASEPQAVWINTADVLRCNNNDQSHHATLLPITAQKRLQIIKVE